MTKRTEQAAQDTFGAVGFSREEVELLTREPDLWVWMETDADRAARAEYHEDCRRAALGLGPAASDDKPHTVDERGGCAHTHLRQPARVAGQFPRACGSCQVVILSERAWEALAPVGIQEIPGEAGLELRNCACGSTLAAELAAHQEAA